MTFPSSHAAGSPHHFLAQLVGGWTGTTRVWLQPDAEPKESALQANAQAILEGRFVLFLYQTTVDGEPHHGLFTFGYDTTQNQYQGSWVDSFHTGTSIMFSTGEARPDGFSILGSYPDPEGGPDWGWRTEIELIDHDRLHMAAYNVHPEAGEMLAVRTELSRSKR